MTPLIIFMIIAVVLTYVLVRFSAPARCRLAAAEAFADVKDLDLQSCPAGTTQYHDKNDDSKCCDGQVVGRECRGATVCRLSPTADPDAPPYCSDYVASMSFNLKGSQIQNPDTGLCLGTIGENNAGVGGKKCDGTQLWTKNALGQIVHKETGKCLARKVVKGIFYFYGLDTCSPIPEQRFNYDYKTNKLKCSVNGANEIYLQLEQWKKKEHILMEKMTKQELLESAKKNNIVLSKMDEELIYPLFYSDAEKPARSTFLSVQPSTVDLINSVKNIFGGGAK